MQKSRPPRRPAHERLLEAAACVFARDGLAGATTRAIAHEAGVNEVTLFRHFRSKERLLEQVVSDHFGADRPTARQALPPVTKDLRGDLLAFGRIYEQRLQENLPLVRAMVGEIHRYGENQRQVYHAIFRPLREVLLRRLEQARDERLLNRTASPEILSDLFVGMIFTGVLRRASPSVQRNYSAAAHLKAAVDVIVQGASV
jgi:AcrR family transcriptional regulator